MLPGAMMKDLLKHNDNIPETIPQKITPLKNKKYEFHSGTCWLQNS